MKDNIKISFFNISGNFDKIFCKFLEKLIEKNKKILIKADSEDVEKVIDAKLWSYDALSFLPHFIYSEMDKVNFEVFQKIPIFISKDLIKVDNINTLVLFSSKDFSDADSSQFLYKDFNGFEKNWIDHFENIYIFFSEHNSFGFAEFLWNYFHLYEKNYWEN